MDVIDVLDGYCENNKGIVLAVRGGIMVYVKHMIGKRFI
jgi:hypothetical protein